MSSPVRKFRPAARLLPWASLLVAVVAVVLQAFPAASDALQYDRDAIAAGEFWRVVSCHLTHCSFDHLVWDVGVLLVLGWLCEVDNRRRWIVCVGLSTLAIPAAIWMLMPQLQTYRGLSGIDSGLFVLLGTLMLKDSLETRQTFRIWVTAAAMLGFVLKTVYELTAAQTIFVDSAAVAMIPVPLAHIVGGLAGLVAALAVPDSRSTRPTVARRRTDHRRRPLAPTVHRISQSFHSVVTRQHKLRPDSRDNPAAGILRE